MKIDCLYWSQIGHKFMYLVRSKTLGKISKWISRVIRPWLSTLISSTSRNLLGSNFSSNCSIQFPLYYQPSRISNRFLDSSKLSCKVGLMIMKICTWKIFQNHNLWLFEPFLDFLDSWWSNLVILHVFLSRFLTFEDRSWPISRKSNFDFC
jgi:hypothetical protein